MSSYHFNEGGSFFTLSLVWSPYLMLRVYLLGASVCLMFHPGEIKNLFSRFFYGPMLDCANTTMELVEYIEANTNK